MALEIEYGRPEWRTDSAAADAEARRRVALARDAEDPADREEIVLSDLGALTAIPAGLGDVRGLRRLSVGDAAGMGGRLYSASRIISGFEALSEAQDLVELNLDRTGFADPARLANLTALQSLNLSHTNVTDLSPLAGLSALRSLTLEDTRVVDIAPLAGLSALQSLTLAATRVADLTPLAKLVNLRKLDASNTPIIDLAPLSDLRNLEILFVFFTKITDVTPISRISSLRRLALDHSGVSSLKPISPLSQLEDLYLSNMPLDDIAPLAHLTALRTLRLSKTQVADLTPLAGLPALRSLDLSGTQVANLAVLLELPCFAEERGADLDIRGTPATTDDPALAAAADHKPPEQAIRVVRYLKSLPQSSDASDNDGDPAAQINVSARAAAVAEAADVDVIRRDDDLLAIDKPGAARTDPAALAERLAGLRAAADDLLEESRDPAVGQVPELLRTRLARYAAALAEDPPRYHVLTPPLRRLRAQITGEARAWLEESGVDPGFLAGLDGLVADHDGLAPHYLPPSEAAAARDALMPPLRDDADPAAFARVVADLREDVDRLATLGHADASLPAAVGAAAEDAELAEESDEARPSALRRAVKVAGVVIVRLLGFGRLARDAGAGWGALKGFFASEEWAAMQARLAAMLEEIESMLTAPDDPDDDP